MEIFRRLLARLRKPPPHDSRAKLCHVMRLKDVVLLDPLTAEEQSAFALAILRCERCSSRQMCDEALAAGQADALRLFCPNAHYVEVLRRRSGESG